MNEDPNRIPAVTAPHGNSFPTFRKVFSRKNARRLLITAAWAVTIIGVIYAEENWRGGHAWKKYKNEAEARGEQLEFSAFVPKPVPPEQNFAATPFIQSMFRKDTNGTIIGVEWNDNYNAAEVNVRDKHLKQFADLVRWGTAFDALRAGKSKADLSREKQNEDAGKFDQASRAAAAPSVLNGLKTNDVMFAELREASRRPYSIYPVHYDLENPWGILLPHLASMKAICVRLQLKACAELALGENEKALADVQLLLYLADSAKEEPFLISYLVRLACFEIALQPVWEGLAEHRWTESQLTELQNRLQAYDFIDAFKRPLYGERSAGVLTSELLYRKKYKLSDLVDDHTTSGGLADIFGRIAPHGWYYFEELNYCQLFQTQMDGTFDPTKQLVSPTRVQANTKELDRVIGGGWMGKGIYGVLHHQLIAALMLPSLHKIPLRAALAQTFANEARLACALERYRMKQGTFPENLDALAPQFIERLPHDIISGEPLKYRRTNDDRFLIYSVGWNAKDDGGVTVLKNSTLSTRFMDPRTKEDGDWVWSYPVQQ